MEQNRHLEFGGGERPNRTMSTRSKGSQGSSGEETLTFSSTAARIFVAIRRLISVFVLSSEHERFFVLLLEYLIGACRSLIARAVVVNHVTRLGAFRRWVI